MAAILSPARRLIQQRLKHAAQVKKDFTMAKAPRKVLDPEFMPHFWHPGRFGVRLAPEDFRARLHQIHQDLEITWHPLRQRWLVWFKKPSVQTTRGWTLIFIWEHALDYSYLPLNELVFFNLYQRSARAFGSAINYFDRITKEVAAAKERAAKSLHDEDAARSRDYFNYTKIKSIGKGSKFTHHHDGSMVPTKAEMQHRRENTSRLPKYVKDQMDKDRQKRHDNLRRMR